jgi:hypothetical protein
MLFVFIPVMLGYGVDLWRTVASIQNKGNENIRKYQEMAIDNVKQNLKNQVDIAYTIMKSNYDNSSYNTQQGKTYLENFYGPRLKNVIVLSLLISSILSYNYLR